MVNLHYRKLTVLPLLKDKTIYLTARQIGWSGLQQTKSETKFEALALDGISYVEFIEKNKKIASNLDIVIESDLCRFVVLPALNSYPEVAVLSFLVQERLKQKYVDFDTSQFIIVHDQLKFNRPCLVVAFPIEKYQKLVQLKSSIGIKNLMPSILTVWNFYEKDIIGNLFLIIENQLAFLIHHDRGTIKEIDTFPVYLIGSITYDYYLDLNSLTFSELDQITSNKGLNLRSKQIIDLLKENNLDKSQALNMMRILS